MILDNILADLRTSDLPDVAQKLARIVDIPTALRICEALAGHFLHIPKAVSVMTRRRWIERNLAVLTDEEIGQRLKMPPDAVSLIRTEDRTRYGDAFGEHEMRTVGSVVTVVAKEYGITLSQMSGPTRTADVAWPRQVAMYLVRRALPHLTLASIGECFGGRDHSTASHAVMVVSDRMCIDSAIRTTVESLLTTILTSLPHDNTD